MWAKGRKKDKNQVLFVPLPYPTWKDIVEDMALLSSTISFHIEPGASRGVSVIPEQVACNSLA